MKENALTKLVEQVARATLEHFAHANLSAEELAVSLRLLPASDLEPVRQGDFRGEELIYPASIVKLFYLAATHSWLEEGKIKTSAELRRAMKDMIVDSSNDATHYVIDLVTGTTSGPELPADEMTKWCAQRNTINDYFHGQGYSGINVNQKPWSDGPYGRERIFVGIDYENRNMLTTNATARLLSQIVQRSCVSPERSEEMMALLSRDRNRPSDDADDQATKFSAAHLPESCRLWSKAGWTTSTRHDAAFIELASGLRFIVVSFTINHASEHGIVPFIAREAMQRLEAL